LLQVPSSITFLDDDAGTPEISDEEVPETEVSDDPTSDAIIHPAKARRRSTSESMASASALTLVLSIDVLVVFEDLKDGEPVGHTSFHRLNCNGYPKAFGGFKRWAQPI